MFHKDLKKIETEMSQFKIETGQLYEDQMNKINSRFNTFATNLNLSETDLKTIKDGVISNTVQISESKIVLISFLKNSSLPLTS